MTAAERLSNPESRGRHAQAEPRRVQDPVCGMAVDPAAAKHHSEHAGHTYYFCNTRCRERFEAEPARYLTRAAAEPAQLPIREVLWKCPMHPQFERKEPGSCPICGMALELMTPSATGRPIPNSAT